MKSIRDKRGCQWEYIPVKETESIAHQDIAGDVMRRTRQKPIGTLRGKTETGEKYLDIYPYKERLGYAEKVAGYIEYGKEPRKYVRVIKRAWAKILIPLLLLCVLIGGGAFWYLNQDKGPDLDESAIAYQMPNGAKNTDPNKISLPGFGTIYMDKDTGKMDAVLLNPEGNPCYFTYIVEMKDTGEELYRSGMIKPGTAIAEWKIEKKLEPGSYEIVIKINTADINDYTQEVNGGEYNAKLEVQ